MQTWKYACFSKNAISKEECDYIVSLLKTTRIWQDAEINTIDEDGKPKSDVSSYYRVQKTITLSCENSIDVNPVAGLHDDVIKFIKKCIKISKKHSSNICNSTELNSVFLVQLQLTEKGGYFRWHKDASKSEVFSNRKSSNIIYLSDKDSSDLSGGSTIIKVDDKKVNIKPERGSILSFRADTVYHKGETVNTGEKYAIYIGFGTRPDTREIMKNNPSISDSHKEMLPKEIQLEYNNSVYVFEGIKVKKPGANVFVLDQQVAHISRKKTFWESESLEAIRAMNLKGVYVDVGAFMGNHTTFFCQECDSTAVFSFEPVRRFFDILSINVKRNCKRVPVYLMNCAIGTKSKFVHMTTPYEKGDSSLRFNPGASFIIDENDPKPEINKDLFTAYQVNLDDMLKGVDENICVIKVDTEGYDLEVLKSAEKTILKHKPVLLIEAWPFMKFSREEIFKYLVSIGYEPTFAGTSASFIFAPKKI